MNTMDVFVITWSCVMFFVMVEYTVYPWIFLSWSCVQYMNFMDVFVMVLCCMNFMDILSWLCVQYMNFMDVFFMVVCCKNFMATFSCPFGSISQNKVASVSNMKHFSEFKKKKIQLFAWT